MDKMPDRCPVCNQKYELEPMFFYGAMYASYAITIAFSVATFVLSYLLLGLSMWWYLGLNAVILLLLFPISFRWARSIWINFFVHYDPKAKTEKVA